MDNSTSKNILITLQTIQTTTEPADIDKSTLNSFYQMLSICGFMPLLVFLISVRVLIGSLGICFNLDLVWITIRNSNLHSSCSILIAFYAFALALLEFGYFPIWFIALSGKNLVRLDKCFWIMALPVFGKHFSLVMMLAIGLDRLKSSIIPWVSNRVEKFWVIFWTGISTAFGLYIIFYGILGIFVYYKRKMSSVDQNNFRLFKSIFVLMLIELFGWATNSLSVLFYQQFFAINSLSDMTKWSINIVFSYVQIIATTANAPALYFCGSEYRKAFNQQFRRWFHENRVIPVTGTAVQ
uniref:G-protein coupled receptors family 1 profile domain-containing protein n=1 Tax=Globodera rostochiensis TaxID=31243 RepID=A0A914I343_GLORO